jgi:hypothetical protein
MNRLLHDLTRRRGLSRWRAGTGAHLLWVRALVARYRRVARRRSLVGLKFAYRRMVGGDRAMRPAGAMQLHLSIRRLISLAAPVSTASVGGQRVSGTAGTARPPSWAPRRAMPAAGAVSTRPTVFSKPSRVAGEPAQIRTTPTPATVPHRVLREATGLPSRIATFPSRPGARADQPSQITTPPAPTLVRPRVRRTATAPTRIGAFASRTGDAVDQPSEVTRSSGIQPVVTRPVVTRPVVMRLPHVTQLTQANTALAAAEISAAHAEPPLLVTHQHIVQRVMARGVRIESAPSRIFPTLEPTKPSVSGRPSHPALKPTDPGVYALPLVRHSPQSRPAKDTDRQSSAGWGLDPVRPREVVGTEHAQIDIERLADKVVGRINDRMIAHRERLGRI